MTRRCRQSLTTALALVLAVVQAIPVGALCVCVDDDTACALEQPQSTSCCQVPEPATQSCHASSPSAGDTAELAHSCCGGEVETPDVAALPAGGSEAKAGVPDVSTVSVTRAATRPGASAHLQSAPPGVGHVPVFLRHASFLI